MDSILKAEWIGVEKDITPVSPTFYTQFAVNEDVKSAVLNITAYGVYVAKINDARVGDFILAPAWTTYKNRVQMQKYDIAPMLKQGQNEIEVTLGNGWALGRLLFEGEKRAQLHDFPVLIACIELNYQNGTSEYIITDDSWSAKTSNILFSDIYDGETQDFTAKIEELGNAKIYNVTKSVIIPQQGEKIIENEVLDAVSFIETPKGEKVIDFGQNATGYVMLNMTGNNGDTVSFTHAEVLDADGNFYNENYRSAKAIAKFTLDGKRREYKPDFTFYGFRYIRIDEFPKDTAIDISSFKAVVVHSELKRTGHFECSDSMLNQLFSNIVWGQKGNFLDVPTDCPQRDERLGWTGDAQVFIRTASYNYNVKRFFSKWLQDMWVYQQEAIAVPHVVPTMSKKPTDVPIKGSAAWGDAATICPWQLYVTYGEKDILEQQFDSMVAWVEYITLTTTDENLWTGGEHYGDWLGLEVEDEYYGATDKDYIATCFYAYSTNLVIKAGKLIGRDVTKYEELYPKIVTAFNNKFINIDGTLTTDTQTAHVLALHFNMVTDKDAMLKRLIELILERGTALTTGFVGTPYLLHVLTENGRADLAYELLFRTKYPSWLYPITKGATTMWEHWDGIKEDGSMWSKEMNSFNHYAYGAVGDWLYGCMLGINPVESKPGFEEIIFKPYFTDKLSFAKASIDTKHGKVAAEWERTGDEIVYTFTVPNGSIGTFIDSSTGATCKYSAGTHKVIIK